MSPNIQNLRDVYNELHKAALEARERAVIACRNGAMSMRNDTDHEALFVVSASLVAGVLELDARLTSVETELANLKRLEADGK